MNATLTAISVFAEQLRSRPTNIQVTESLFMLLINFVTFFGNLLLGIVVIKNPTLRRTVPSMYIITLALSDFLNSCLGIPFSVASLIVGRWPFNDFVCQLQGFWILLLSAVSLQTLAVTAVNRYFRVVRSRTLYQKLFNKKTTKLTIAVLWILALLLLFHMLLLVINFSFTLEKFSVRTILKVCIEGMELIWWYFT